VGERLALRILYYKALPQWIFHPGKSESNSGAEVELKGWRFIHCADFRGILCRHSSYKWQAAQENNGEMVRHMNWLHPAESALRKPYNLAIPLI
jgi:hypothetical protein